MAMDVSKWTCQDVCKWLQTIEFGKDYEETFLNHKIDGVVLLSLTESDLRNQPLCMKVLGDIKKLWMAINTLQNETAAAISLKASEVRNGRLDSQTSECSISEEELSFDSINNQKLRPEYLKLFLSFIYMSLVLLLTAYVMVIVHDRVPDMTKYPPLPDLVLDNVPHIPWAFKMCEITILILMSTFILNLFFHKHRYSIKY